MGVSLQSIRISFFYLVKNPFKIHSYDQKIAFHESKTSTIRAILGFNYIICVTKRSEYKVTQFAND